MSSLLSRSLEGISGQAAPATGPAKRGGGARASPYGRPDTKPAEGQWKHDMFGAKGSDADNRPTSGGPRRGGAGGAKSKKLLISQLHYEVSEKELELLFVQIGPLESKPRIHYDKSGRSLGRASITYTTEDHASRALQAFNGAVAKGQEMAVTFDYHLDRVIPAPGTLLARLDSDEPRRGGRKSYEAPGSSRDRFAATNSASSSDRFAPRGERGDSRGGRGGRGGSGAGRGGGGARGDRGAPKTNDDLDKELEAFMQAPGSASASGTTETNAGKGAETSTGDVEMS